MENIKLKGARNVRDLGGLPVYGGVIKPKLLLRSDALCGLTDEDIDTLILEYGLKTVIDLRNTAEKTEQPDYLLPELNYLEMPIFDESLPGMSHESKQDVDNIPYLGDIYRYVMNSDCVYNLGAVVKRIVTATDGDGAILYHCTEGKDRTGMVTAILLLLLGARRETILEDYLFTNTVNHKKAVKYRFLVKYFKRNPSAAEKVYNVFLAKEEYINEVFTAVDKMGLPAFTRDVLKLSGAELRAFQERVVEKR